MFDKKKSVDEMRKEALELIRDSFDDMETLKDGNYVYAYINGVADLAFNLELIDYNERNRFIKAAADTVKEINKKAEGEAK